MIRQNRLKRLTPLPSRYKRTDTPSGPKVKQNPKTAHPFVFRGLLWCADCNRRFVGQHSNGQTRYFCGSRETTHPCQHSASIREAQFLPWVDDLMTGLECGQLEALLERERGLRLRRPLIAKATAAGVIENIDARIKRPDTRFALGTIDEDAFRLSVSPCAASAGSIRRSHVSSPTRRSWKAWQPGGAMVMSRIVTNTSARSLRSSTLPTARSSATPRAVIESTRQGAAWDGHGLCGRPRCRAQ